MTAYVGASIRLGFKSGDMDRLDDRYGNRIRIEALQVDKEIGLGKGVKELGESPAIAGDSPFYEFESLPLRGPDPWSAVSGI